MSPWVDIAVFVIWTLVAVAAIAILIVLEVRWERREKAAHTLSEPRPRRRLSDIDEQYRR